MDNTIFEELVQTITPEERQNLLDALSTEVDLSDEPLSLDTDGFTAVDLEKSFQSLNVIHRFFLFIKSLFTGKAIVDLMEDHLVAKQIDKITKVNSSLIDFRTNQFDTPMFTQITQLEESLGVFKDPLRYAFEVNKGEFYAFLGNHFIPDISVKLLNDTNPWTVRKNHPDKDSRDIKALCENALESAMMSITNNQKTDLYVHARVLYLLHKLSSFNWKLLTAPFLLGHPDYVSPCPVSELREGLEQIADIIQSLTIPPTLELLEVLFLFNSRENLQADDSKIGEYLKLKINYAEKALGVLRTFNKQVPLRDIIQFLSNNVNYNPEEVSGGEDWFQTYRKFWESRSRLQIQAFIKAENRQKIIKEAANFLGKDKISVLENYNKDFANQGISGRYCMTMAYLKEWYSTIMVEELNPLLKKILVDGDFYKKDNRAEFTDSYNNLLLLGSLITDFSTSLEPEYPFHQQLMGLVNQNLKAEDMKKEVSSLVMEVDLQAENIIKKALDAQNVMVKVLKGIVYGELGGKYDTLSNISHINFGGKGNFRQVIDGYLRKLEVGLKHLAALYDTESAQS
ncbi:DUF5312 family protein [Spirochaeta cellobiosiphila]|uniref:DUF5312 family protein n=1 Tax=Spirochaeta cellobiosiphila TaxID=504483 RepID=UPI00041A8D3F|nr:DUF5312 family protein [Spirochaeta cellobiosiphila]